MFSGNAVLFGQKWLYSSRAIVQWKCGCIRAKCLYWGRWLYSGKSGCIREKSGSIRAKVVVIGQSGCFRAMLFYSDRSGCIREGRLYSGNVVVFGQNGCIRVKGLVFGKM